MNFEKIFHTDILYMFIHLYNLYIFISFLSQIRKNLQFNNELLDL